MDSKNNSVVYVHRRGDNQEVFYVGHGSSTRPMNKARRNREWYRVVDSVGYTIEILHENLSKSSAIEIESHLISSLPNLVNDKKVNSGRLTMSFDLFNEYFFVDESSPTGLKWKKWNGGKSPANCKNPGDVAGSQLFRPNGDNSGIVVSFKGSKYMVHRIVWLLSYGDIPADPSLVIDHINNNPFDNRISNLRQVNYQVNALNARLRTDNKSGVQGVSYNKMGSSYYYTATWREDSKVKAKNFSISKYGEDEALRLATEHRNTMYKLTYSSVYPDSEKIK